MKANDCDRFTRGELDVLLEAIAACQSEDPQAIVARASVTLPQALASAKIKLNQQRKLLGD